KAVCRLRPAFFCPYNSNYNDLFQPKNWGVCCAFLGSCFAGQMFIRREWIGIIQGRRRPLNPLMPEPSVILRSGKELHNLTINIVPKDVFTWGVQIFFDPKYLRHSFFHSMASVFVAPLRLNVLIRDKRTL